MPIQLSHQDFQPVVRALESRPLGASIKELMAVPGNAYAKRTLQRRLDHLVKEGQLLAIGEGRARRYRLAEEGARAASPAREPIVCAYDWEFATSVLREDTPEYVTAKEPFGTEAREIRDLIRQPLSQRTPVGYRGEFLDAYQPNRTFYLPASLRSELAGCGELPAGTYLRQMMDRLLIDLSWNSSRLEGNTYSLLETQRLLEHGEETEGRGTHETQMILNHKAAIEMLADEAAEIDFNRHTICNLHALLADNLLADPGACGRVRSRPVGIGGTVFHPLAVPQQVEERFEQILAKAAAIRDPFEQAFFAMVHLPYLQPFEDVNKRVSRLAANIPLIRANLCPLSFVDVDPHEYIGGLLGVYELNRVEYLRDGFAHAYRRSCARYSTVRQSLGEPDPFRLRHRTAIGELVRAVVAGGLDKREAARRIAEAAELRMATTERARFIEVVETELGCLHPGNIARYRLRPSEFEAWMRGWR